MTSREELRRDVLTVLDALLGSHHIRLVGIGSVKGSRIGRLVQIQIDLDAFEKIGEALLEDYG
jgi:hypothetical protein